MAAPALKEYVKRAVSGLPGPFGLRAMDLVYRYFRPRTMAHRRRQEELYTKLGRPARVLGGLFKGMQYIDRATGSEFLPKILGTYELELIPAVEAICRMRSDRIIDIGAAEGYYAVGLLLRNATDKPVLCYDIYKPARYLLTTLAKKNNVMNRIDLRPRCDAATLERDVSAADRPVIICDCEGYEDILLDPQTVPSLTKATILVELHEQFAPGVTEHLRARFARTHDSETYSSQRRTLDLLPPDCPLPPDEAMWAMDEQRSQPMQWFLLTPKKLR